MSSKKKLVPDMRWLAGERRRDPARGLQEADWVLNGTLASPNCGAMLSMNLTITHVEKLNAKSINYTLMMTAVAFFQVSMRRYHYC